MQRKGGSRVAVAAEEVKAALGKTESLTSEEEKVLRMRFGATEELKVPLSRMAGSSEPLADELLLIEMQLLRAHRSFEAQAAAKRNESRGFQLSSAQKTKHKIIRALRRKK